VGDNEIDIFGQLTQAIGLYRNPQPAIYITRVCYEDTQGANRPIPKKKIYARNPIPN
jgi:hypothetical protein